MRDRRYLFVIPLAALLALLPLLLRGNSCGHDFEFHLFNWLEVGSQWKQRWFFPHWDFTAASNSGEPRFVFYPPLSWTIGALLGLVLPWAIVPIVMIWLALTACGFTMRRLARQWTGESCALIAAALYMVHPYMLFTFYERSAYAELLAAAWFPLLLSSVLQKRVTVLSVAIPVALLWLTNAPAAIMGCYALGLLSAVRVGWKAAATRRTWDAMREGATILAGFCLGLALAGFYLVPAIVERTWVEIRMVAVPGVRVQDNFLFGQFGSLSHRAILRTASLCSVALLTLIAIAALISWLTAAGRKSGEERQHIRKATVALLMLAAVLAFALTAPSAWFWLHLPELIYLQFPWRLNAILGCAGAALLAMALSRARIPFAVGAAIAWALAMSLSFGGDRLLRQSCNRGNDPLSLIADFATGRRFDPTDEYTPQGAEPSSVSPANPNAWIAATPSDPPPTGAPLRYSVMLADRLHLEVVSPEPAFLVLNLRYYPAWQFSVNGLSVRTRPYRSDGLTVLPIARGDSKIDIDYTLTWDRVAGWLVAAIAGAVALAISRRAKVISPVR